MIEIWMRAEPETTLVSLRGRLDAASAPKLAARLHEAITSGNTNLIVDLSQVDSIDGGGLVVLLQARNRARECRGRLALCGLQLPVLLLFKRMRLDTAFELFADAQHAALSRSAPRGGTR